MEYYNKLLCVTYVKLTTCDDSVFKVGTFKFLHNQGHLLMAKREGINPSTGDKIQIAAKKVVKFKAGSELANAVAE